MPNLGAETGTENPKSIVQEPPLQAFRIHHYYRYLGWYQTRLSLASGELKRGRYCHVSLIAILRILRDRKYQNCQRCHRDYGEEGPIAHLSLPQGLASKHSSPLSGLACSGDERGCSPLFILFEEENCTCDFHHMVVDYPWV